MKIKDLDPQTNLGGLKVKTTDGTVGYWRSQWQKGVWLVSKPGDTQINPIFLKDIKEALEWEVLEEDK